MSDIANNGMGESLDVNAADAHEGAQRILPGAQLAAQRQALGWSVEQISAQLKVAPRQVLAIEQDNYDALPGFAVTRGFIRAYAKLLKLDVVPLLALMRPEVVASTAAVPLRRALPTTFSETRLPLLGNRPDILTRWNIGVVLLIFLLLIALLAQQMNWIPALPDSFVIKVKKETALINTPALAAVASAEDTAGTVAVDARPTQIVTDQVATEVVATDKGISVKGISVPATSVESLAIQAVESVSKNQLVVKTHEDSWIDVKRKNGSSVFSRLLKAGASESFDVGEGLSLTVGNAGGVEVLLRGEPLEIKSSAKNNIARVKLK